MSQKNNENLKEKAGYREWIGLAILGLPTMLLSMDASVLYLATPHLVAELQATSTQQLWIMDIYAFLLAGFLITMGTIGDQIGRRKLLMIGATAFGITSIIAAFSVSAEMLIISRALLGIAGATLMPSTLSLLTHLFRDEQQRSVAIGVWMTCFTVGGAIGPAIGGILIEHFWWGSVFLIAVPVMVLLLITAPILLPEYRNETKTKLDLISVFLSLATLLPLIYGMKQLAKGEALEWAIVSLIAGLIIGIIFINRQKNMENPLFDFSLFKNMTFSTALSVQLFGMIAMGGTYFFMAQYLQLVLNLPPFESGLWMIVVTSGMILGTLTAPWIARWIPVSYVMPAGLLFAAIGFFVLSQTDVHSTMTIFMIGAIIAFYGMNVTMVLTTNLVVGSIPLERSGAASSLSETSSEMGVALGVAILGSISTAVYRREMSAFQFDHISVDSIAASRDTLAGAVDAAASLSTETASQLLTFARESFLAGMSMATLVAAGAVIVLSIFSFVILRKNV